ncbi:MAG: four helix bundle protein, partial [Algoriphagus sp.]
VVGWWLVVVGCWLVVFGWWFLVGGCWLLVGVGCWLVVVCWLVIRGLVFRLSVVFFTNFLSALNTNTMSSYRDLDIYKISFSLFLKTHPFSLRLPKYELYELGSQLRRSSDSVITNIVEGYGRRSYKNDFIKFLVYSEASGLETVNHLEKIQFLYPQLVLETEELVKDYKLLGGKIHSFADYVRGSWRS